MREAIWHEYKYPNFKSRVKTLISKLLGFYRGLTWEMIADFELGEGQRDASYSVTFRMEILKLEWCGQREILIIREFQWFV